MNLFIVFVAFLYLVIAQRIFNVWFKLFQRDTAMSLEESRLSWLILILGSMFWLLIVPISYIALLEKQLAANPKNLVDIEINNGRYYPNDRLSIVLDSIKN